MGVQLLLLLLPLLNVLQPTEGLALTPPSCSSMACRPGRECRTRPGEAAHCACVLSCPEHWKPVCGSDGISYDNHCSLHRAACLSGSPVSPLHPGFCRKRSRAGEPGDGDVSAWRHLQTASPPAPLPAACSQGARDALRLATILWLHSQAPTRPWYRRGMSRGEELSGEFQAMDRSADGFLDSEELAASGPVGDTASLEMGAHMRQLCLDALVEEGDTDFDWRLSPAEYQRLLQPSYVPTNKECSLSGRSYRDGAAAQLECNSCVCSCGKWICTSLKCPQGFHTPYSNTKPPREENEDDIEAEDNNRLNIYDANEIGENKDEDEDYDEEESYDEDEDYYEDEDYDEDDYYMNPENDPDVAEVNWF